MCISWQSTKSASKWDGKHINHSLSPFNHGNEMCTNWYAMNVATCRFFWHGFWGKCSGSLSDYSYTMLWLWWILVSSSICLPNYKPFEACSGILKKGIIWSVTTMTFLTWAPSQNKFYKFTISWDVWRVATWLQLTRVCLKRTQRCVYSSSPLWQRSLFCRNIILVCRTINLQRFHFSSRS